MVLLTLFFGLFQSSLSRHEFEYLGYTVTSEKVERSHDIEIAHLNGGSAHLTIEAHLHDQLELIWSRISSGLIKGGLSLRLVTLSLDTT